jgi:hypothetical protein
MTAFMLVISNVCPFPENNSVRKGYIFTHYLYLLAGDVLIERLFGK